MFVSGNALDDLHLEDPLNLAASLDRELETGSPTVSNSISVGLASSGLLGSSAPVNIPGSARTGLGSFSPSTNSPLQQLQSNFLSAARFSHPDPIDPFMNHSHMQLSSSASKINSFSSLFDFTTQNISPSSRNHNNFSISPSLSNNLEITRLREELASSRAQIANWEDRISQARTACEAWQREMEESNRKAQMYKNERDEQSAQIKQLQMELERERMNGSAYVHSIRRVSELRNLSLSVLKSIQAKLRSDLEEVDKVLYLETATKCMVCEEQNRSVTLPCNHYVLCNSCAPTQKECPYCQMSVNLPNNI